MVFYCEGISALRDECFNLFFNIMPPERQQRVMRYVRSEDRLLGVAAYALLGYALSQEGIDIRGQRISCDENGKPFFVDLPLKFNISHSRDVVACAISDCEVGVDIQQKPDRYDKAMRRSYCADEIERVNSTTDFTRIWTLKESYAKCIGTGIFDGSRHDFSSLAYADRGSLFGYDFVTIDEGDFVLSVCSHRQDLTINKISVSELYSFWNN